MEIISEKLQNYLLQHCEVEPELLQRINRETHLKILLPRMLSGHYQGRVLKMLCNLIHAQRILEIGTFTGYATLCMAESLAENGLIYTIDINEELEDFTRQNFETSGLADKINFIIGNAVTVIPTLNEVFDLVFIDADKKNNYTYYQLVFDKVRAGGLIIVDNVLWSGKIADGATDADSKRIDDFNKIITADNRVEKLILPVRDGLFLIRKK